MLSWLSVDACKAAAISLAAQLIRTPCIMPCWLLPALLQFLSGAMVIMLQGRVVQRVPPIRRFARRADVRLAHQVAAEPQLRHTGRERALPRHRHCAVDFVCVCVRANWQRGE